MKKILNYEKKFWEEKKNKIAGFDEAGRGAIAGPLVVAGVIIKKNFYSEKIRDSKILSDKQRKIAFNIIKENSIFISIIFKSTQEIEKYNPSKATEISIIEIFDSIPKNIKPNICLIDGQMKIKDQRAKWINIIKGDDKSINIAAASIIAKVTRDKYMIELDSKNNGIYEWSKNKGYPNQNHVSLIIKNGVNYNHRKTYEPIKSINESKLNIQKVKDKYKIK